MQLEFQTRRSHLRKDQSVTLWPVLLYLGAVLTPAYITVGPLHLTFLRILCLVLVVPAAMKTMLNSTRDTKYIDLAGLAFIAWWTLSILHNTPERFFQQSGSFSVEFLGGYFIGRAYIDSAPKFEKVIRWLTWSIIVLLPFAVIESLTERAILLDFVQRLPFISSPPNADIEQRLGLHRAQVVFTHPIHYGLYCALPFSLILLQNNISLSRKLLLATLLVLGSFFALSSGPLLAILLQVTLIGWDRAFHKSKWKWWALLIAVIFLYISIDLLSDRTPLRVFMTYATFSPHNAYYRAEIFDWGLMNIFGSTEHGIEPSLLLGIGQNDWVRPEYMWSASMDNFWLVITVQGGIPAFLMLLFFYLLGITKVSQTKLSEKRNFDHLRKAWLFSLVGLAFTLTTVHVWGNMFSYVFFLFGSGIWMSVRDSGDSSETDQSKSIDLGAPTPSYRRSF